MEKHIGVHKNKNPQDIVMNKEYFERTVLRLNYKEKTLLKQMMEADDWENVSGFIKYKLFGFDENPKYKRKLKKGTATDYAIALREIGFEIVKKFDYLIYLYNKNTNQLWREEGVDMKAWIKTTKIPFERAEKAVLEYLSDVKEIAKALKLDKYFEMPSDKMNINAETATVEEMDALAKQLREERAFMGHSFKNE